MVQLHEDFNFHYEAMRAIGTAPYGGADITEIFNIMPKIKPGDFDSWHEEWFGLAQRVLSTVDEENENAYSPITLRNVYFRVSHYFFVADFFLHGNKSDPRAAECYQLWRKYFDKAMALLPTPGKHVTIPGDGFEMPAIVFKATGASSSNPRPLVIIGGGFESIMEETFHAFGLAALDRDYNVLIYEGPGHRALVNKGHGFVAEWEKAVSPIIDYVSANRSTELAYVDMNKIGLVGMSLGGYLAARAAAFEPRLAAVMCIDGVLDMLQPALDDFFPRGKDAWEKGDGKEFDRLFDEELRKGSTSERWFHDDLKFTFCTDSAFEAFKILAKMNIGNGVAQKIKMPAYIADATEDMFFQGQPPKVVEAIGANATLKVFGRELGGQLHCQSGGLMNLNQDMFEWFAKVVGH